MIREEWAISRTTVYAGMDNPNPASTGLSEYAGAEEIDAAIASLRQSYTDYGRLLKKHPDDNLQRRRRGINTIIKSMREENRVPHGVYLYHAFGADPLPAPLDAIVRRYLVAKQAADEAWERDVAATPVCPSSNALRQFTAFQQDGLPATEVDVGGREVFQLS